MDLYFFVKKYRLQIKMVNIYKKNIKKKVQNSFESRTFGKDR
jgi:hypothetical protein